MSLAQKLVAARKQKGLTQEELADLANVTVRTIQRMESGETIPRSFTLKAIASALTIPFEELNPSHISEKVAPSGVQPAQTIEPANNKDFLQMLCLSCFSYLVIPYVHFLIPGYLLKRSGNQENSVKQFGRSLVRQQVICDKSERGAFAYACVQLNHPQER